MLLALLVLVPALVGLVAFGIPSVKVDLALLLGVAVLHATGTALLWTGAAVAPGLTAELGAVLTIDATGLLFLSIASGLFLVASLYTIPYVLGETHDEQAGPDRFVPCLLWFLSAMTLVTATANLAIMWAAVEATTLASAPLVYFYKRRGALEATWKYLLICSVGIALALLGVFSLGIAAEGTAKELTLGALASAAPSMSRPWLVTAFVLALVGYGTKMGLAPMHTWLPDTHSQAPSPVSALLSGALLNCALLAVLRFYQVCLASGDAEFARTLLLTLGFGSIGIAAAFMVAQRDYKRLLAYSSIENMGIIAVGLGLGGGATYGAMLHALNHSLCKAGLFFVAGNVLRTYGTTDVAGVRGALRKLPASGWLLMVLVFAIGGAPPFGPFISELVIFRAALASHTALGVLFVALLAVAFLGMAGSFLPMLQGEPPDPAREGPDGAPHAAAPSPAPREPALSLVTPLAMACGALLLGVYIPGPISNLLQAIASLLGEGGVRSAGL